MTTSLILNGMDVAALGYGIRDLKNYWDVPATTADAVTIPGRPGQLRPPTITRRIAPRSIDAVGTLRGRNRSDFLVRLDLLKSLVSRPAFSVRLAELPNRVMIARPVGGGLTATGPIFLQRSQEIALSLLCDDPYAYDGVEQQLAFDSDRATVPLGTGPSTTTAAVRVTGPATNPVVTLRDGAGVPIETLGFTVTIADGDWIEVSLDTFLVTHSVSGVVTDGLALMTSGNISTFLLEATELVPGAYLLGGRPRLTESGEARLTDAGVLRLTESPGALALPESDVFYASDSWPTIAVSQGTGLLRYRRAWA